MALTFWHGVVVGIVVSAAAVVVACERLNRELQRQPAYDVDREMMGD